MELKKCPFCNKTVLAIAKACKYCSKSFEEKQSVQNENQDCDNDGLLDNDAFNNDFYENKNREDDYSRNNDFEQGAYTSPPEITKKAKWWWWVICAVLLLPPFTRIIGLIGLIGLVVYNISQKNSKL